jgi:AraC-like DNA-binding protein
LDDRALLISQIEALEVGNPGHPRLGQWKARLTRLDQVLEEISQAELRAVNGEAPARPREQLVPQDPAFERPSPQLPIKRTLRERRRKAIRNAERGPFKRKHDVKPLEELDANKLALAEALMRDLETKGVPMAPYAFALRLGTKVRVLYQYAEICDRLSAHNRRYTAPLQEMIEAKLEELRVQGKIMTVEEFARYFGIAKRQFYISYPEFPGRLHEQNKLIQMEQAYREAEQHLQELVDTQTGQKTREFAKQVHIDIQVLRKQRPDIIEKLIQHNKALNMPGIWSNSSREERIARVYEYWERARQSGESLSLIQLSEQCHFVPQTIRRLCPELIPQLADSQEDKIRCEKEALSTTFAEVERSNQIWTIKQFAAAAGVSEYAMCTRYRHWAVRFSERNVEVVSTKLQTAWDRMVTSEEEWTLIQFARAAKMDYQTLKAYHQEWIERLRLRKASFSASKRVQLAIEDAKDSSTLITLTEVAQKVGINRTTLMRKYSEQYASLVEHNKTVFVPVVQAAWRKVCESDLYPTVSEFAEMCGFRHFSILLVYFPDSAKQVRNRLKSKR